MYPVLLFIAIFLEVFGAVLFIVDSRRGAQMLVSPVLMTLIKIVLMRRLL